MKAYSNEHADEVAALNADEESKKQSLPQDLNLETVTLDTPIVRSNTVISQITIRKPKAGSLRGLSLTDVLKLEFDAIAKLVPRVASPVLVEHDLADMDLADFTKVATAVVGFFASPAERAKAKANLESQSA